ncbi:hypothetical protein [Thomasclavelia sp.]|uniref:hypothetical protein n=1 Tax=Thomasclavelia sp. TaxID=3025757 RepID=UPI0025D8C3B1|nr:hypothetical protein [Thomasclavelia sp.]
MKKIIPLALIATLLVGCGSSNEVNYSTEVSDGDKTVISGDDVSISKNDIYHYLLKQYGSSEVLALALTYIADQEITDKDQIQAAIDEQVASYTSSLSISLEEYAKQSGYESAQEYIDEVITDGVKQNLLLDKYINDNYDDLVKDYKVKYLKLITLDTESAALNIIDQVKDGADFDTLMNENSGSDEGMVTTESSSIDENIIKKLDKFTKDGIYSKVIKTSDSKYAVVYVYNSNIDDLTDEIKKNLSSISNISTKMGIHYLRKYNFDVYEDAIKDEIKEENEDYFG